MVSLLECLFAVQRGLLEGGGLGLRLEVKVSWGLGALITPILASCQPRLLLSTASWVSKASRAAVLLSPSGRDATTAFFCANMDSSPWIMADRVSESGFSGVEC